MRVCYVGDGTHIHDQRFIRALVHSGIDLHVVSFERVSDGCPGATYHYIPRAAAAEGRTILGRTKTFVNEWLPRRTELLRVIHRLAPDVLHAGWIPEHGLLAALTGFHPLLLMPWGSDVLIYPRTSLVNRIIARFVIRRSDMITCDAEFVKEGIIEVANYPADRIVVIPWGVDRGLFNSAVSGDKIRHLLGWNDNIVLVMNRRMEPIYGWEGFLRALPLVFERIPEARALLCDTGPLEEELQCLAANLGITHRVYFAGSVNHMEMPSYLAASDIFVSTSLSDGTSVSLLEAMACGLPVVVTDNPAILEWVTDGKNGYVVRRDDVQGLSERLCSLAKDEQTRLKFGERNEAIVAERASWDTNVRGLLGIYESLVGT